MRGKAVLVLAIIAIALLFAPLQSTCLAGDDLVGKKLYLQANIWYEKPMNILSTNYHRGVIIPAGSQVTVTDIGKKTIEFKVLKTGEEFRIVYAKKHNPATTIEEYAGIYFGQKNPLTSGIYKNFTKKEKQNVKAGTIEKGMRKDAVFMAYGLPPSHKTSSLDNNVWYYWDNRFIKKAVTFRDNMVQKFQ